MYSYVAEVNLKTLFCLPARPGHVHVSHAGTVRRSLIAYDAALGSGVANFGR